MLTAEQITGLNLGVDTDPKTVITINAAMDWLKDHTTIDIDDTDNLPACAKLFLIKYTEISGMRSGIASESIEGLSISYSDGNASAMIWDIAFDLLGSSVKSPVRFVTAEKRWN